MLGITPLVTALKDAAMLRDNRASWEYNPTTLYYIISADALNTDHPSPWHSTYSSSQDFYGVALLSLTLLQKKVSLPFTLLNSSFYQWPGLLLR